jgi:hypothetical protein
VDRDLDPRIYAGLMDPVADPDHAIFVIDLQDTSRKLIKKKFLCLLLFEGTVTSFSKIKSQKEVINLIWKKVQYFSFEPSLKELSPPERTSSF